MAPLFNDPQRSDMSNQLGTDPDTSTEQADRARLVADLEHRIDQLEALDDSDVGSFTTLDWFFCFTGAVVIPVIALWLFAP
jgi:hypothetical protein